MYSSAIKEIVEVDTSYAKLQADIQSRIKILDKPLRSRSHNEVYKKNRNAYARLLLEQLKCGRLEEPFHNIPPASPLPTLNKALLYPYTKPKTSASSSTRPKHRLTPSQELDNYLFSQAGGASSAPFSPLPFAFPTASAAGPTATPFTASYAPLQASDTTAASAAPWGTASLDNSADPFGELSFGPTSDHDAQVREAELELRLLDAEEKLKRHSALLSLALDMSSLAAVEGGAQTEENRKEPSEAKQQREPVDIEKVLQRAETQHKKPAAESNVDAEWPQIRKSKMSGKASPSAGNYWSTKASLNTQNIGGSPGAVPSEDDLLQRLIDFELGTASLQDKVGALGKNNIHGRPRDGVLHLHFGGKPEPDDGKKTGNAINVNNIPSERENAAIAARHTLKSAAAAKAIRHSLQDQDVNFSPSAAAAAAVAKATASPLSLGTESKKAVPPLRPRPGSTAALVSEVVSLRKRLAANLASFESSSVAPLPVILPLSGGINTALGLGGVLDGTSPSLGASIGEQLRMHIDSPAAVTSMEACSFAAIGTSTSVD